MEIEQQNFHIDSLHKAISSIYKKIWDTKIQLSQKNLFAFSAKSIKRRRKKNSKNEPSICFHFQYPCKIINKIHSNRLKKNCQTLNFNILMKSVKTCIYSTFSTPLLRHRNFFYARVPYEKVCFWIPQKSKAKKVRFYPHITHTKNVFTFTSHNKRAKWSNGKKCVVWYLFSMVLCYCYSVFSSLCFHHRHMFYILLYTTKAPRTENKGKKRWHGVKGGGNVVI